MFNKKCKPMRIIRILDLLALMGLWGLIFGPSLAGGDTTRFDFGEVEIGDTQTTTVSIYNYENDAVSVTGVAFAPEGCPDFSILSQPQSMRIPAEGKLDIAVAYSPSAAGECSNVLRIWTGTPLPNTVAFSGTGVVGNKYAAEKIQQILTHIDTVAKGAGPGKSAAHRLNAVRNMVEAVAVHIKHGQGDAAYQKLSAIYQKVDGRATPKDFVAETSTKTMRSTETLAGLIQDLMTFLKPDAKGVEK